MNSTLYKFKTQAKQAKYEERWVQMVYYVHWVVNLLLNRHEVFLLFRLGFEFVKCRIHLCLDASTLETIGLACVALLLLDGYILY